MTYLKTSFLAATLTLAITHSVGGSIAQERFPEPKRGDQIHWGMIEGWAPLMSVDEIEYVLSERLIGSSGVNIDRLAQHLWELCETHQFEPAFVLSVIETESSFRVKAVSPKGAVGLMQLMPGTAAYVAKRWGLKYWGEQALYNPYVNLNLGITYLAYLRDRFRGRTSHFLAAYNVGPSAIGRLVSRNAFYPVKTKPYIDSIKSGVSKMVTHGKKSEARREEPRPSAEKA